MAKTKAKFKWAPGPCCGCKGCCTRNPVGWSLATATNWGSGVVSCNTGNLCSAVPSPLFTSWDFLSLGNVFPDFWFGGGSGSPPLNSYVKEAHRAKLLETVHAVTGTGCQWHMFSGLYRSPEESGCRLVVLYIYSFTTSNPNPQNTVAWYRSPIITNCCAELTLDRMFSSGWCNSPPLTITATPVCS